ncbi:MAG: hypothetical protein ACT4O1_10870 [Gemmatimonadota bacterium]
MTTSTSVTGHRLAFGSTRTRASTLPVKCHWAHPGMLKLENLLYADYQEAVAEWFSSV